MPASRSRLPRWFFALAVLLALAATHSVWLSAAGNYLVLDEPPWKADIAVVLGGGWRGNRILKAAELVRSGYVRQVLVSGAEFYSRSEAELAIEFAVRQGYPRDWFLAFPNPARSTWQEAGYVVAELRRRGVRRFLLVTSDYHTRRARACFRRAAPEIPFRIVAAPDPDYQRPWWRHRESQKVVFLEWTKMIAWRLGM